MLTLPGMSDVPYRIYCDVGTTFIKAGLFDCRRETWIKRIKKPSPPIQAKGGDRYESSACHYVDAIKSAIDQLLTASMTGGKKPLACFSFQRSSFVLFNKHSMEPVSPLIIWKDQRASFVNEWSWKQKMRFMHQTGIPVTPFYVGPKMKWMLEQDTQLRERIETGEVAFATLDAWCLYVFSLGKYFLTDTTMASRTGLFDVNTLEWSKKLFKFYHIPFKGIPDVKSFFDFKRLILTDCPFDWGGSVADQVASLSGAIPFKKEGSACLNLGTAAFVLFWKRKPSKNDTRILKTPLCSGGPRSVHWMMEAPINGSIRMSWQTQDFNFRHYRGHMFQFAEQPLAGAPLWIPVPENSRSSNKETILNLVFRLAHIIGYLKLKEIHVSGGGSHCRPFLKLLNGLSSATFFEIESDSEFTALNGLSHLSGFSNHTRLKHLPKPKKMPARVLALWKEYPGWIAHFLKACEGE